jgi:hypothetical protein
VPQLANALHNANKLKLSLFSLNADGGIAITKVPERWLSFVNFKNELPFFIERVLPLLRQAGLRK